MALEAMNKYTSKCLCEIVMLQKDQTNKLLSLPNKKRLTLTVGSDVVGAWLGEEVVEGDVLPTIDGLPLGELDGCNVDEGLELGAEDFVGDRV